MKQAIQEELILDVPKYYTPVESYFKLIKKVESNLEFNTKRAKKKASALWKLLHGRDNNLSATFDESPKIARMLRMARMGSSMRIAKRRSRYWLPDVPKDEYVEGDADVIKRKRRSWSITSTSRCLNRTKWEASPSHGTLQRSRPSN